MLSRVIGQEIAKKQILNAYRHERLAHAYLITGDEGLGAEELAVEMAKFLLCANPDRERFEPCRQCANCRKVSEFQHADVHYYFPTLKSTDEEMMRDMLQAKANELYTRVYIGGGSIHIGDPDNPEKNSIRGLARETSLRSFEGNKKIFILTYVNEMNDEAANAFLKILEEPPPTTFFFLTATRLHTLLPTIISRCQVVKLSPVKETDIKDALITEKNIAAGEAQLVARLANGNYGKALELIGGDLNRRRKTMLDFLVASVSPQSTAIVQAVDAMIADTEKDKAAITDILLIMLAWFQDIFYISHLQDHPETLKKSLINHDLTERLEKFVRNFPRTNTETAVFEIEKAVDLISRNVYLNLVLVNLGLNLRHLAIKK